MFVELEVGTTEGSIVALGFLPHRDVRLNVFVIDDPPGRPPQCAEEHGACADAVRAVESVDGSKHLMAMQVGVRPKTA
jgi:hypothetical protein